MMMNTGYLRVLLPVEDLPLSESVINFVANHRWSPETQFKILHVGRFATFVPSMAGIAMAMPTTTYQENFTAAAQLVDQLVRRLDAVVNRQVEGFVEEGEAKDVIMRYAQEWPADLIVMASHCRHGLDKWLMGSVSRSIADAATCSTIIVHNKPRSAVA